MAGIGAEAAAVAIRNGKVVKVTVGGASDAVLLAWLTSDGQVMSEAVDGWCAGVREPVCFAESEYLTREFLKDRQLAVVDQEPFGGRGREVVSDG